MNRQAPRVQTCQSASSSARTAPATRPSRVAARTCSRSSRRAISTAIATTPSVTPQIAIYDDGVGTENFKPLKLLGGATGWGLSRNVRQLYKELCRVYDPGDEIFLFGFSRGAFTVRTLVGLIATCGLIDPRRLSPGRSAHAFTRAVNKAYSAYRLLSHLADAAVREAVEDAGPSNSRQSTPARTT